MGLLAKYQNLYGVTIYSFVMMGNHYHLIAKFPNRNKSAFMRSFNSGIARKAKVFIRGFEGRLWERRYADQAIRGNDAVENWFFYSALNPVLAGISRTIDEYENYNSFLDSIYGVVRKYRVFNATAYYIAKRWGADVRPSDFYEEYKLMFTELPGNEDYSKQDYREQMQIRFEERRLEAIKERTSARKGFMTKSQRAVLVPGQKPRFTKTSYRYSFRPLVLTLCRIAREEFLNFYFSLVNVYREASIRYSRGDPDVLFPSGTYKPPIFVH